METTITIRKKDDAAQKLAAKGVNGDTELAHVNPWEEMLLKALGGAGTTNPNTGLKQFYTTGQNFTNDIGSWYKNAFGRDPSAEELTYWQNADKGTETDDALWGNFLKGASGETYTGWTPTNATPATTSDSSYLTNFPTNIAPTSTSTSTGTTGSNNQSYNYSVNQGKNQSTNQSKNQSESSNMSYSGLPTKFVSQLLTAIIPQLISTSANMEQRYDDYTNAGLSGYNQQMNNALRENIPAAIAGLANRGIINSTEGQKVLSDVYSKAATEASNKGYQTLMQAALAKANIPTVLAQIAQLGQTSTSEGQSTSSGTSTGQSTGTNYGTSAGTSTGTSFGNTASNSYSTDPTQMYQILANMITSMM